MKIHKAAICSVLFLLILFYCEIVMASPEDARNAYLEFMSTVLKVNNQDESLIRTAITKGNNALSVLERDRIECSRMTIKGYCTYLTEVSHGIRASIENFKAAIIFNRVVDKGAASFLEEAGASIFKDDLTPLFQRTGDLMTLQLRYDKLTKIIAKDLKALVNIEDNLWEAMYL